MKHAISILLATAISLQVSAGSGMGLHKVIIDAGHGGKDPGAISRDRKTYEKNLTLDISKRLAAKIQESCPTVEVILTRTGDSFVSLDDRAVKANKAGADLFISIHINSTKSSGPSGYSAHILGQSSIKNRDLFAYNMDVCKRENSVILLEDDYSTKYQGFDPADEESFIFMQLMQNAYLEQSLLFAQNISSKMEGGPIVHGRGVWQNPFYVLWKTAMPAVLVELGFISNDADLAVLRSEEKRTQIAERLCQAFILYKDSYDSSMIAAGTTEPAEYTEPAVSQSPVRYGCQVFALKSELLPDDKRFLGYEAKTFKVGTVYKYVIGISEDIDKSRLELSKIRKTYPNAFLVKIDGGITPVTAL